MTKLEPTLTNSDLMATERLRELLDERGVEWTEGIARPELTQVRVDGKVVKFHSWQPNTLKVSLFDITPEQAIAAMLGLCNCTNGCTNSERTDAPSLPHFWTHDGTLHVELPKLPNSISVRLPDVRDREVRSARTWQYTLGNGGVGRTNDGLADLQAENAKLRELAAKMARALGINSEWCDRDCEREFGCYCEPCPLDQALRELGVEVDG